MKAFQSALGIFSGLSSKLNILKQAAVVVYYIHNSFDWSNFNMTYFITASCYSDVGKKRSTNEDNFYFDGHFLNNQGNDFSLPLQMCSHNSDACFAVFDGIGGEAYGGEASLAAASAFAEYVANKRVRFLPSMRYLRHLVNFLNQAVVSKSQELASSRMGTTLACIMFHSSRAYCVNVGDSRIYLFRDGHLSQLSIDHSFTTKESTGKKPPLSQYLGMDPTEVFIAPSASHVVFHKGDIFLICSDGLTDMLDDEKIHTILQSGDAPSDLGNQLLNAALSAGGKDNTTLIVCLISEDKRIGINYRTKMRGSK